MSTLEMLKTTIACSSCNQRDCAICDDNANRWWPKEIDEKDEEGA